MADNKDGGKEPGWWEGTSFGILPVEAYADRRLHHADLLVLGALSTFANAAGTCYPKRETVGKITGLRKSQISRATTRLEEFGWLTKVKKMRTALYTLTKPAPVEGPIDSRP